jgi:asparagine synthase (glutamine-hydrolysing)
MCGVFGIVAASPIEQADLAMMRRLSLATMHRGPDGEGSVTDRHVLLGMRRLAIIDVAGGNQPIWNEAGDQCVLVNGEIYNHVELRNDLERQGHRFRTGSDCETLLHLIEGSGYEGLNALRGMFAAVHFNRTKSKVSLIRDRVGEKPLYVVQTSQRVIFASELRALIAARAVPFELDIAALAHYLHFGFIPEPWSAVCHVQKLPPAHLMEIGVAPWSVTSRRWWSLESAPTVYGEPPNVLRAALDDLAPMITRSDRPVGVALSGGVDSSIIAALAARHLKGQVTALSIGYEGGSWQDETAMAAQLARFLGIPHRVTRLTVSDVVDGFPSLCMRRDEPIADIAGSGYDEVFRSARDAGVPVVLMGHGGDELFWGYKWVRDALQRVEFRSRLRAGKASVWDYLRVERPPVSWTGLLGWISDGAGLLRRLRELEEDKNSSSDSLPTWDPARSLHLANTFGIQRFHKWPSSSLNDARAVFRHPLADTRPDLALTQRVFETFNTVNGIAQADRLSMSHGVECRLPFCDYRFVETVIGLRRAVPDDQLPPKAWLRAAAQGLVPDFVFVRRKRGFTPPWKLWYRELFRRFGASLDDGALVQMDLVPRGVLWQSRSAVDLIGRPKPFFIHLLVLEMWAQGMRSLVEVEA